MFPELCLQQETLRVRAQRARLFGHQRALFELSFEYRIAQSRTDAPFETRPHRLLKHWQRRLHAPAFRNEVECGTCSDAACTNIGESQKCFRFQAAESKTLGLTPGKTERRIGHCRRATVGLEAGTPYSRSNCECVNVWGRRGDDRRIE